MKIKHIHIENFRSLKSVDIYPGNLCVFVEENNAGKDGILQTLNSVSGETWSSAKSLRETDFFGNDMDNLILISLDFKDENETVRRIFFKAGLEDNKLKAELKMNYWSSTKEHHVNKEIRKQFGTL